MPRLAVELYGHRVGELVGQTSATFDFVADPAAVGRYGLGSTIVSQSVPLELAPTPRRAHERRNFFAELLPEAGLRDRLAARARLDPGDTLGMLARYGRDLAGALQIYDPAAPGEPMVPRTEPVSDARIGAMLRDVTDDPLGNDHLTGRSSLGGVQEKIVLALVDGQWCQVHGGAPSTHIIKVAPPGRPTLIHDEEYGSRAARALGLATFDTRITDFDGVAALVVERYDRDPSIPGGRIHQEDMNQALGTFGARKYQGEGSPVSLLRIADIFRPYDAAAAHAQLARQLTLSIALGNLDMHAKNLSVLHPPARGNRPADPELGPAYDIVPMRHHITSRALAMYVAGEADHAKVTAADVVEEAASWGLRDADAVVESALADVATFVAEQEPHPGAHPEMRAQVTRFVERLRRGDPAGD